MLKQSCEKFAETSSPWRLVLQSPDCLWKVPFLVQCHSFLEMDGDGVQYSPDSAESGITMVFTGEMDQITRHECEEKAKAAGAKVPWHTEEAYIGQSETHGVHLCFQISVPKSMFSTRFKAMSLATCSTLSQTPWFDSAVHRVACFSVHLQRIRLDPGWMMAAQLKKP